MSALAVAAVWLALPTVYAVRAWARSGGRTHGRRPRDARVRDRRARAVRTRLRSELARTRRPRYWRAATGTAGLGAAAIVGALLFPAASTVLIALGRTGLFIAVLVRYLTPERFVSATIGRWVYEALSAD